MLDNKELERYARQVSLLGEKGQAKLKAAKVLVAGAGGLGSAVSIYLVAAGVGRLRVVDPDRVKLSNLNRQVLYLEKDVGKKKVRCVRERLAGQSSWVEIEVCEKAVSPENATALASGCDGIVDALDNFRSRYFLNKAALALRIPLFHGAIRGFYGQSTTVMPGRTACLKCIFPQAPLREEFPAIGPVCGIVGSIQACEVIKHITGKGRLLENRLLVVDGLNNSLEEVEVSRRAGCEDCSEEATFR